ncbi:hypothetical protein ALI144C_38205 [Actinosynnema sp. ALI-1.44]|uniref:hypothetical protein n=1 Tax=Actinosynnema sp. ALI-1.44 TaxID=1933779 RepID=UPI00097BAD62|nr:hypothetical protein [Actinosynnema sp. ALI-1.44]ONI74667.1 hypothetical protein ALI144C_38205 [Actinosynnema sp. ALI-1.44]
MTAIPERLNELAATASEPNSVSGIALNRRRGSSDSTRPRTSIRYWACVFGHSGAGGQRALVDPRNEVSYAFLRHRFLLPAQADADHGRLLKALLTAVHTV